MEREARLEAEVRAIGDRLDVVELEAGGRVLQARELLLGLVRDVVERFPHDGDGDVVELLLQLETLLACGPDPREEAG